MLPRAMLQGQAEALERTSFSTSTVDDQLAPSAAPHDFKSLFVASSPFTVYTSLSSIFNASLPPQGKTSSSPSTTFSINRLSPLLVLQVI